jgi:hypothetical protein
LLINLLTKDIKVFSVNLITDDNSGAFTVAAETFHIIKQQYINVLGYIIMRKWEFWD